MSFANRDLIRSILYDCVFSDKHLCGDVRLKVKMPFQKIVLPKDYYLIIDIKWF